MDIEFCPFCGVCDATVECHSGCVTTDHTVVCNNCEAEGPYAETEEEAIRLWNTREDQCT